MTLYSLNVKFLLFYPPYVSPVPVSQRRLIPRGIVVSFIQTQLLSLSLGALHHYLCQSHSQEAGLR